MTTQEIDGMAEFRFYRRGVRRVGVAGDFNGWDPGGLPMTSLGDGWWACRTRLAPGVYQFKYWADGEWLADYAAFGLAPGPHGLNSVLYVEGSGLARCS